MISQKMEKEINSQITREMYSAYLYMSISANASRDGLKGIATWFMVQYHEEMVHAMKMYEYIIRQGGRVVLDVIQKPPSSWKSPLEMFENALEHEKTVTKNINNLLDLAVSEKDHASQTFFHWYVTEQIEEEDNATDITQKLRLIGDNAGALYLLDKELGARMLTVPSDFSKGVEAQMGAAA